MLKISGYGIDKSNIYVISLSKPMVTAVYFLRVELASVNRFLFSTSSYPKLTLFFKEFFYEKD